jgi:hypothetical protein
MDKNTFLLRGDNMGVDYKVCKFCEDTFPDCGKFVSCECGEKWCSDSCAEADGFRREPEGFTPEGASWVQDTSCNFCRSEDANDSELFSFALELLSITRSELVKMYFENK